MTTNEVVNVVDKFSIIGQIYKVMKENYKPRHNFAFPKAYTNGCRSFS